MTYLLLAVVWLAIWVPLMRRTLPKWEMLVYGTSLIRKPRPLIERLNLRWKEKDVQ